MQPPPWITPFYSETSVFAKASVGTHFQALVNFSSHSLQTQISSLPMFAVDGRLSGNLGLAWISVTPAVGDRGAVKGDLPGAYPLAYTHTCLCRIPLHFQALFRLESGGSKQVHSSPCPV